MLAAAYCESKPGARLEFHVGWSGWTRPSTMGRGGRGAASESVCKRGVGVVFRLNALRLDSLAE